MYPYNAWSEGKKSLGIAWDGKARSKFRRCPALLCVDGMRISSRERSRRSRVGPRFCPRTPSVFRQWAQVRYFHYDKLGSRGSKWRCGDYRVQKREVEAFATSRT